MKLFVILSVILICNVRVLLIETDFDLNNSKTGQWQLPPREQQQGFLPEDGPGHQHRRGERRGERALECLHSALDSNTITSVKLLSKKH